MTSDTRVTMHKGAAALVAIALLAVGAGAMYLSMRNDAGAGGQRRAPRRAAGSSRADYLDTVRGAEAVRRRGTPTCMIMAS